MIRISFLLQLLLLTVSLTAFCQDFDYHQDFEKILSLSKDNSSSLYFPKLLQGFRILFLLYQLQQLSFFLNGFVGSIMLAVGVPNL